MSRFTDHFGINDVRSPERTPSAEELERARQWLSEHSAALNGDVLYSIFDEEAPRLPPTSRSPKSPGYVPRWAKAKERR